MCSAPLAACCGVLSAKVTPQRRGEEEEVRVEEPHSRRLTWQSLARGCGSQEEQDRPANWPLLPGEGDARGLPRAQGPRGGWVVMHGSCRCDLWKSMEKGVLQGIGASLFLLLLRAAAPEAA